MSFSLDEQNSVVEVVVAEYTECFLPLPNNNSEAMLSHWDRETDPVLNCVWFQLDPPKEKRK